MRTTIVLILFLLVMGIVGRMEYEAELSQTGQTVRVEEDTPMWDCTTMGNFRCGTAYPIVP